MHLLPFVFNRVPWMIKIIVVVAVDDFDHMRRLMKQWNHDTNRVVLVPGEDTRHGSIYNGIKYMESGHSMYLYKALTLHFYKTCCTLVLKTNAHYFLCFRRGASRYSCCT